MCEPLSWPTTPSAPHRRRLGAQCQTPQVRSAAHRQAEKPWRRRRWVGSQSPSCGGHGWMGPPSPLGCSSAWAPVGALRMPLAVEESHHSSPPAVIPAQVSDAKQSATAFQSIVAFVSQAARPDHTLTRSQRVIRSWLSLVLSPLPLSTPDFPLLNPGYGRQSSISGLHFLLLAPHVPKPPQSSCPHS